MVDRYENDVLRPLHRSEIKKMIEICAQNLPLSVRGYNFLRMNLMLRTRFDTEPEAYEQLVVSDYMRRAIYTKRDGNLENCTFISVSGAGDYNVFVFSNDVNELRECLMHTNVIDYALGPFFISMEGRHRNILAEVFAARNVQIAFEVNNSGHILAKADARKLEYEHEIPDDVVVESLHVNDVNVIDAVWPHRYPGSTAFIKTLIGLNDSIGVFSKDGREIRAWVILNEHFGLGLLHTLPVHRGKGYAKIAIKALSKIIAEKYDLDVFAFIVRGNTVSEHTFAKLGFTENPMESNYSWVFTKKQL